MATTTATISRASPPVKFLGTRGVSQCFRRPYVYIDIFEYIYILLACRSLRAYPALSRHKCSEAFIFGYWHKPYPAGKAVRTGHSRAAVSRYNSPCENALSKSSRNKTNRAAGEGGDEADGGHLCQRFATVENLGVRIPDSAS
jgi:hypothetical protein